MKVINRSQLLAIFLTITLFGVFLLAQINQQDRLYGFQPYVQQFFTDFGEPDQLFNQRVEIYSGEFVLPYNSLLRTTMYTVSEGGTIDSTLLFQYAPVFLRMLYVLLIMMIVIAMTDKVQYALVTGLVVFTSPFFVFRSPLVIPENIALLFFLLMIWGFEKYKQTGRVVFMLVVILSILGNALYQPTSILISSIIVIGYTIVFLFSEDPRKIEVTFFSVLISLILLLPMFGTLLAIVSNTMTGFGDNAVWEQYRQSNTLVPTVTTYFELIGYPVTIFAVLGVIAIVRRAWRRYLHLLVMLGCMILLMLNISPTLEIDPGRMQAYLYIVLVLIAAVYISQLFTRTSRLVRMMLIAVLVAFGIATMLKNPPWQRLSPEELEIAQLVNQALDDNPDEIVYVETEAMSLATLVRHPDQLCAYWDPIYQLYIPPATEDIPDCTVADYRIARTGRTLPDYRIVQQTDTLSLYQRIVDA